MPPGYRPEIPPSHTYLAVRILEAAGLEAQAERVRKLEDLFSQPGGESAVKLMVDVMVRQERDEES